MIETTTIEELEKLAKDRNIRMSVILCKNDVNYIDVYKNKFNLQVWWVSNKQFNKALFELRDWILSH